jgi:hypothetical protein
LADYTEALAYFTALLALVSVLQVWLLYRGDTTARTSADAARRSAEVAERTLAGLETPYLYPIITDHNVSRALQLEDAYPSGGTNGRQVEVWFRIKNYGRSPALIRTVAPMVLITNDLVIMQIIDIFGDHASEPVLEPAKVSVTHFKQSDSITKDELASLKDAAYRLFFVGEIGYFDIFGNAYRQS